LKKVFIFIFSLVFLGVLNLGAVDSPYYDFVFKNGLVVDGTGFAPYKADVALLGGKIAKIGDLGGCQAGRVIDANGLVVSPGFIDILRHNDLLWSFSEQKRAIEEGITSGLVGNCGFSVLDVDKNLIKIQKEHSIINLGTLIGQGSVRDWFVKTNREKPATPAEMEKMKAFVEKALRDGAFGLSSGLGYEPGEWCEPAELQDLTSVLSKYPHAAYYTHIRNYRSNVLDAIQEAIQVAQMDKVPVIIQHLLFKLPSNWDQTESGLLLLEQTREKGLPVYATVYPYDFWGNEVQLPLFQFLYLKPESIRWAFYHSDARTTEVLNNIHRRLQEYGGGNKIEITRVRSKAYKSFLGLTIKDLAQQRKMSEESAVLALLLENGGDVKICYHGLSEEGLIKKIQDPNILFGSDSTGNIPHPRDVGAFPRLIGNYVRDKRVIRLSEVIHRLTEEPARLLGLKDRGTLKTGNWADLVVFDYRTIGDRATAVSPWEPPRGIKWVLVNGHVVLGENGVSGTYPGRVLRRTND
jgi:N-acyl-D-aspartate/D-glutamate deacylase